MSGRADRRARAHARAQAHDDGRSLGLDLLRAIAVCLVLISHWANNILYWFGLHAPQPVFFSGDLGVDLFFALSGFLIGRILIGIAETLPDWHALRIFLLRRALRTLPLYFVWLTLLLCFTPPRHEPLIVGLRFLTLTQNLITPMPADYYFAVSWSLTIEEWFYLLFSSAFIFGARRSWLRARSLWVCAACFMLVPLALRLYWFGWNAQTIDLNKEVFFRIDAIAYGVVMARLYLDGSRLFLYPAGAALCGVALVALAWATCLPVPVSLMPALTPSATVLGCCLCLPAALRLQRAPVWCVALISWISTRSYALYIVHWTIMVNVVQARLWFPGIWPSWACAIAAVSAPFMLADLSYRFFEMPILRHRPVQHAGPFLAAHGHTRVRPIPR